MTEATDRNALVLVSLPAGQAARRGAFATVLMLLAIAAIMAPFASVPLPGFVAFVSISQSLIFINDLITSMLLMAQFVIVGWRAILVLAVGYLFTALLAIIHLLTFPGAFTPTGLLGAGLQTAAWLYEFWHSGFPFAVILYVVMKDQGSAATVPERSRRVAIAAGVTVAVALALSLAWLATAGEQYLPKLFLDRSQLTPIAAYVSGPVLLLSIVALLMLWFRRRSILDLWLMVAMCAWSLDIIMILAANRFTLGFYASRMFAVATATSVLIVLLWETMTLYIRLAVAVLASDFAHMNRVSMMGELAASLSHEIAQPIASARNNARAAMNFLDMQPPDLHEVKEALGCIVGDADRAGDIVGRIRDQIKKKPPRKELFDLNAAINEVIALARSAITHNGVSVHTRLEESLPPVHGDRVQLQQVVLNLIMNAVEAMGAVETKRELSISTEQTETCDGVLVEVRDSGPGIDADHLERVFETFYTTKPQGTGVGLSICRSIVSAHGGRLSAEANQPCGSKFQFTLPRACV